jgi:hypothetical protein
MYDVKNTRYTEIIIEATVSAALFIYSIVIVLFFA